MSINISNSDLSLTKIASNPNVNKKTRGSYLGREDTLFLGDFTTGVMTLNGNISDYDYIDIEYSNSDWLRLNSIRYRTEVIQTSSSASNNKLRGYGNANGTITFYKYGSNQLYFNQNSYTIKKITGYKRVVLKSVLDKKVIGKEYEYYPIITDGTYYKHGILRNVFDIPMITDFSSNSYTYYHYLNFRDTIEFKAFAIKPNGQVYVLPYIDENGNSTCVYSSKQYFNIVNKNLVWEKGTIFRIIVDFTKYTNNM